MASTPWPGSQRCHHHLSDEHTCSLWVTVLLTLLFQQGICLGKLVVANFIVIFPLFSESSELGETLLYLFSASKILCHNCKTSNKGHRTHHLCIAPLLCPIPKVPRCLSRCTKETCSHDSKDSEYPATSWAVQWLSWTGKLLNGRENGGRNLDEWE